MTWPRTPWPCRPGPRRRRPRLQLPFLVLGRRDGGQHPPRQERVHWGAGSESRGRSPALVPLMSAMGVSLPLPLPLSAGYIHKLMAFMESQNQVGGKGLLSWGV